MSEINEVTNEEELKKQYNKKKRIVIILGLIATGLLAYTGYLTVQFITDLVRKNSSYVGSTITILDKNESDSLKLYNEWMPEKSRQDFGDIALYGGYLLTSDARVSKDSFHLSASDNKIALFKANESNDWSEYKYRTIKQVGELIDEQINLFDITEIGEYLLFDGRNFPIEPRIGFHYTGNAYFDETIYSLPDSNNIRRKIEVKAKASSPAVVIKVTTLSALPEAYYDFVVYNTSETTISWLDTLKANYKVYEASSLEDAYSHNAPYAINVTNEESEIIYSSNYVKNGATKSSKINGSIYDGEDKDSFIRELGGYTFNAGYGLSGNEEYEIASRKIKNVIRNDHIGKYALKVGKNATLEAIKNQFGI